MTVLSTNAASRPGCRVGGAHAPHARRAPGGDA